MKVAAALEEVERLRTGNILVTAIVIEPWQLAACVAAYLQTAVVLKDGELPPANVRIG